MMNFINITRKPHTKKLFSSFDNFISLLDFEHASMINRLFPSFWSKAHGATISDENGNDWIDFTSSVAVANSGHGNTQITKAISEAINSGVLTTFTFPHKNRFLLDKKITNLFKERFHATYKCHFLSGGSEAVECALDLACSYKKKKKSVIVSFFNAFHGNTAQADMLSGNGEISMMKRNSNEVIYIKVPYVHRKSDKKLIHFEKEIFKTLKKYNLSKEDLVAIIVEPYQGRGVFVLDIEFATQIQNFCKENGALLIVDEIQSGFFRTGKLFASEYFDFSPDLVCLGKGLSSSLPISGVIGKKYIFDNTESTEVLTTHSYNPVCTAAAKANIEFLTNQSFQKELDHICKIFSQKIEQINSPLISYKESFGMAASIHIIQEGSPSSKLAKEIVKRAAQSGLALNAPNGPYSSYIRFTPPLVISEQEINKAFSILQKILEKIQDEDNK